MEEAVEVDPGRLTETQAHRARDYERGLRDKRENNPIRALKVLQGPYVQAPFVPLYDMSHHRKTITKTAKATM